MILGWAILAVVALQRLGELVYASRNTSALRRRGGIETGRGHYPLMVLLHASWLAAVAAGFAARPALHAVPLVLYASLQPLRIWTIATLGPFWTTRVITVPGAPLVRSGPYRFVRHPNYAIVTGEIALLPLGFDQPLTAVAFSIGNAFLLAWRIREEERALADR